MKMVHTMYVSGVYLTAIINCYLPICPRRFCQKSQIKPVKTVSGHHLTEKKNYDGRWTFACTVDSLLTDTSIRQTARVGSCLYLTVYKTDISLSWTLSVGPKAVRLRKRVDCILKPPPFPLFVTD